MDLFLWLLLNLGVPVAGPVCTLVLVAPAYGRRAASALIGASVRDGQMFWCATCLCAASAYDAVSALQRDNAKATVLVAFTAGLCVLGFASSSLAMLGSLNVHNRRTHARTRAGLSAVEVGLSFVLTLVAAVLSVVLHVMFS